MLQIMDSFIGPAQENLAMNTATMKGSRMYTFYGTRKVWKLKYFQECEEEEKTDKERTQNVSTSIFK